MSDPSRDPTAIDIAFDPRAQRMRGVAIHGRTPFDVPFISEIAENLWQGGCRDGLVLPRFIEHSVSLYRWEAYTVPHELASALVVTMYDSNDAQFGQVDAIARWVNACREDGPTLVNCQAGLNRSSLVVVRALMLGGMSSGDAIALVRERRSPACLCNPSFESWLRGIDGHAAQRDSSMMSSRMGSNRKGGRSLGEGNHRPPEGGRKETAMSIEDRAAQLEAAGFPKMARDLLRTHGICIERTVVSKVVSPVVTLAPVRGWNERARLKAIAAGRAATPRSLDLGR